MQVDTHNSIAGIRPDEWNGLNSDNVPFLRHEFLAAAENSGSVCAATGWEPQHMALRDTAGRLVAAMPLYRKTHSWGEFVFDWAWAHAYEQAGLAYYPKLVSAVPFTPASSRRVLTARRDDVAPARELLQQALACASGSGISSLHIQFPDSDELPVLQAAGFNLRKDCQFHWHNRGYRSFADFLAQFSSRKRKKVRRDRRHVAEYGVRFHWLHGDELDDDTLQNAYRLISNTFLRRGSLPYLNLAFFREMAATLPRQLLVVLAKHRRQAIAAAVFFVGPDTLYGRYWGADAHYNALHFETCYYQGIDYCIENGLGTFEPGTQGEHKVSRGFLPVTTWSAHWLAHPEFFSAVSRYLAHEQRHVERYMEVVDEHSPFRKQSLDARSDGE